MLGLNELCSVDVAFVLGSETVVSEPVDVCGSLTDFHRELTVL